MKNLRLPAGCWLPVRRALKPVTDCFSEKQPLEFVTKPGFPTSSTLDDGSLMLASKS